MWAREGEREEGEGGREREGEKREGGREREREGGREREREREREGYLLGLEPRRQSHWGQSPVCRGRYSEWPGG